MQIRDSRGPSGSMGGYNRKIDSEEAVIAFDFRKIPQQWMYYLQEVRWRYSVRNLFLPPYLQRTLVN